MYGITADELHDRIIEDLRYYCEWRGMSGKHISRIFDNEKGRPIEHTIRLVIEISSYYEQPETPR